MKLLIWINKALRLNHINILLEPSMKESDFHIHVVKLIAIMRNQLKSSPYRAMLYHKRENVNIIHSRNLTKIFCHQMSFEFQVLYSKDTFIVLEHPPVVNGLLMLEKIHQVSSMKIS